MTQVDVQEARTRLNDLLLRAERGEDVVIARAGRPVARLVAVEQPAARAFGVMRLVVPDDVDAPLDENELAAWE